MNKLFVFILSMLMGCGILNAEQRLNVHNSAQLIPKDENIIFYLLGPKSYLNGSGGVQLFDQNVGDFKLSFDKKYQKLEINYSSKNKETSYLKEAHRWHLEIGAPKGQLLEVGSYQNARRMPDNKDEASLDFGIDGRGCNRIIGAFEILEWKIDKYNQIEACAINFVLHCEGRHPAFGGLRYNSSLPIQTNDSTIFGKELFPESFLYYTGKGQIEKPVAMMSPRQNFSYIHSVDQADGIMISIEDELGLIGLFEFNTLNEKGFSSGLHEESSNDSTSENGSVSHRINCTLLSRTHNYTEGEFEVIKFRLNNDGKIEELALNFKAYAYRYIFWQDSIEGCIRYNTDVPVDLSNPYNQIILNEG